MAEDYQEALRIEEKLMKKHQNTIKLQDMEERNKRRRKLRIMKEVLRQHRRLLEKELMHIEDVVE